MRIKTDSKQFEMKEDPITEEVSTDREIPLECDKSMETEVGNCYSSVHMSIS